MRVNICGIHVDSYVFDEVLSKVIECALVRDQPRYVVTPNAHHIWMLQSDSYFREIYRNAFLVVPDGVSLLWAGKFLNNPLQGRVNGTDLFEEVCRESQSKDLRLFFLGGRPGAAVNAARTLLSKYPDLNIVGTYCPPYGFETNMPELLKINQLIKSAAPNILFVGLGAPKQEKWIYENYRDLNIPVSIGIGVSFELVSGMVTRAPKLLQKLGLEWFFRFLMEPRRLWKRYFLGNSFFILLVLKQRLGYGKKFDF